MQMKSWFIISVPMCLCACVCGYVLLGLFNAFYSFRCFHRFASDGHKERSEKCVEEYLSRLDSMLGTKYAPGQSIMMDSPSVPTLCNALTAHEHPDVLEWGSGGTTTFFSQFSSSWHSIEHEKEWADQARTLIHLTILKHIYFPRHAQQEIWSTLTGTNNSQPAIFLIFSVPPGAWWLTGFGTSVASRACSPGPCAARHSASSVEIRQARWWIHEGICYLLCCPALNRCWTHLQCDTNRWQGTRGLCSCGTARRTTSGRDRTGHGSWFWAFWIPCAPSLVQDTDMGADSTQASGGHDTTSCRPSPTTAWWLSTSKRRKTWIGQEQENFKRNIILLLTSVKGWNSEEDMKILYGQLNHPEHDTAQKPATEGLSDTAVPTSWA